MCTVRGVVSLVVFGVRNSGVWQGIIITGVLGGPGKGALSLFLIIVCVLALIRSFHGLLSLFSVALSHPIRIALSKDSTAGHIRKARVLVGAALRVCVRVFVLACVAIGKGRRGRYCCYFWQCSNGLWRSVLRLMLILVVACYVTESVTFSGRWSFLP